MEAIVRNEMGEGERGGDHWETSIPEPGDRRGDRYRVVGRRLVAGLETGIKT